jgi:hypothetical protein
MRFSALKVIAVALFAAGLFVSAARAQFVPEPKPYYVEFRAAVNGAYGHSYVAFGRLDPSSKPATTYYADLHPTGSLPELVIGHVVPISASTRPRSATRSQKIAARYLRPLTEPEYNQLTDAIAKMRATKRAWSLVAYNCNDFVAEVAGAIGMKTPNTLTLPHEFIQDLQALNAQPSPTPPAVITADRTTPAVIAADRAPPAAPVTVGAAPPAAAAPAAVRPAKPAAARPAIALPSIEPLWRKITSERPVPPAPIPNARQTASALR